MRVWLPVITATLVAACKGGAVIEDSDQTVEVTPPALQGAATSSGGGRVESEGFQLNVVVGDPMPASDLNSENHTITVGVGTFVRER